MQTYSFLDTFATLVGPGGSINLAAGAGTAEEGITIAATDDINTMTIGADGKGMHSLHADVSGDFTVRLLKTSPVNSQLQAMYSLQTTSSILHGQNTVTLVNVATGDNVTCQEVAFRKAPDLTYAKDGGLVEWIFSSTHIYRTLGAGMLGGL